MESLRDTNQTDERQHIGEDIKPTPRDTLVFSSETTEELTRQDVIECWIGDIQLYLEARIADAPTESCAVFARNLWDETAEFYGDVG